MEWNDVTVTLVDPIEPASTATLNSLMETIGYSPPKGPGDTVTQSKQKSDDKLGPITIQQIDSNGDALETWTLHAPFIKKITYGKETRQK